MNVQNVIRGDRRDKKCLFTPTLKRTSKVKLLNSLDIVLGVEAQRYPTETCNVILF